ncbi:hypothetical protein Tco_0781772 [Tanacetum coccineum]
MDSDKYLEGQSMQIPPLFESDSFIYWENRFETYVKSKDLDLWHVITNGDFQPIVQNPKTKLDEVILVRTITLENVKVHEMIIQENSKCQRQRLKGNLCFKGKRKESSEEECSTFSSEYEDHREIRTKEHLLEVLGAIAVKRMIEKNQEHTCLLAQAPNEVLGFNSFEASSSGTKEIKFVKAQKKASPDGGPINMGGPLNVQAAPKINMGPPPATPVSEKSVSFQKSILGPRPKHIIVNKVKVPVASDNEVKQFYKPLSKPEVGFSKLNFRSKTPPPRRVNNNFSRPKTPQPKRHVGRQNQPHGFPICLGVDLEPDEWIKDSGCSKHMTGNRKLFSTYKAYNGGNVIFGSNLHGNIIGKVSTTRCLELLHMDGPSAIRSYGGNRHTAPYFIVDANSRKIEESLNVTFDETPPPAKTSPLVDDDLDEEEAIREIEKKNLENIVEDETLEIDEIVNIKESKNHPLENVIGNLN